MTVGFSDSHPTLYVVSPWCNRLGYVLFGPRRTGLALPWTTGLEDCLIMHCHALEKGCLLLSSPKEDSHHIHIFALFGCRRSSSLTRQRWLWKNSSSRSLAADSPTSPSTNTAGSSTRWTTWRASQVTYKCSLVSYTGDRLVRTCQFSDIG